jgi:hypothetical protein
MMARRTGSPGVTEASMTNAPIPNVQPTSTMPAFLVRTLDEPEYEHQRRRSRQAGEI